MSRSSPTGQTLNTREAAAILRVGPATVADYIRADKLTAWRDSQGHWQIETADLLGFLSQSSDLPDVSVDLVKDLNTFLLLLGEIGEGAVSGHELTSLQRQLYLLTLSILATEFDPVFKDQGRAARQTVRDWAEKLKANPVFYVLQTAVDLFKNLDKITA